MKNKNQSPEGRKNRQRMRESRSPLDAQSQAGVNRHTSSEEVEMVKHSPGTQNQICANCGHHKRFHINEFTNESECLYGWRIGEKGVINIGCDCKKFIPQNHTESEEAKGEIATPEGLLGGNPKSSGSAPKGDFCLKDVKVKTQHLIDGKPVFMYLEEGVKEFVKRLKNDVFDFGYLEEYSDLNVSQIIKLILDRIDKLSGFNNDDEREGER